VLGERRNNNISASVQSLNFASKS